MFASFNNMATVSFIHESLIDIYNNADFSLFDTFGKPQSAFSSVSWSYFCKQTKSDKVI